MAQRVPVAPARDTTLPIPAALDGVIAIHRLRWLDPWPHRHRELELNLILSGHARYALGARRYELRPHQLVWLFPGQGHILLEQSDDFAQVVVVFRPRLVRAAAASVPILASEDPPGSFCRSIGRTAAAALAAHCAAVAATADDPALHNVGLHWLLLSAWRAYTAGAASAPVQDLHPAVALALARLERDPGMSLAALARAAGLSAGRLGRVFRQQLGRTIARWRTERRLEEIASSVRAGTRRGLLELALAHGFGSYTQFHREVVRLMGIGPRAWRRQLEERSRPALAISDARVDRRAR